jgi:N-acetylglucosamine-6-phosphate deacetylase
MRTPAQLAITADTIFDGTELHRDSAVIIEGARIGGVIGRNGLPKGITVHETPPGIWLAPGFIDVQVNGGGDVWFNDDPAPEAIFAIAAAHRKFGTTSLLPTLITDTRQKMQAAADAVRRARATNPAVLGIHFEGPFLSPEKPGVHCVEMMRAPDAGDLDWLTSQRDGVTLITLAPERAPTGFVAGLVQAGIVVSLGHSMATYDETKRAIADGLTGFTHLFNAMPALASRAPGPIAAALESPNVWYGLIVDGHHVDAAMLRLALRGAGHPMLVTDAMPPVGGKAKDFKLYDRTIEARGGRCTTREGRLAGSVLDMASAVRNCVNLLGLPLTQALRLASYEPAAFLGLSGLLGAITPRFRADLVALEPKDVRVLETWVAGQREAA